MSNFKIGEKVVCIGNFEKRPNEIDPIKGEIYTIREIIQNRPNDGKTGLKFEEIINLPQKYNEGFSECNFLSDKFRKLDHQFADKICAEIIESLKVEVEQLN